MSFYRAAVAVLGKEPPWGALTGVRPVKIPTKALLRGETPARAEALLRDTYHVTPVRRRLAMDCARASLAALDSLKEDGPGPVRCSFGKVRPAGSARYPADVRSADRKSTRLNSSHSDRSRMPSSA